MASATPGLTSDLPRIRAIAEGFIKSVDTRFGQWGTSDVITGPVVAYKISRAEFVRAKDIVLSLMPADLAPEAADGMGVFAAVGLVNKSGNEKECGL